MLPYIEKEEQILNIDKDIMATKQTIIERQDDVNKFAKKLDQRDEYISEVKLVLKQNYKELEKELKRAKTEAKQRKNSSLVSNETGVTDDTDMGDGSMKNYYGMKEFQTDISAEDSHTFTDRDSFSGHVSPHKMRHSDADKRINRELIGKLITQHNRENTDSVNCSSA